uniref:Gustatory receptor n=1 Tax=Tetranychus urticae TaxID=32264 RepID=T1KUQ8_TETUR
MKQKLAGSRLVLLFSDLWKFAQLIFRQQLNDHDFEQLALSATETMEHQIVFYFALRLGFDQSVEKLVEMKRQFDLKNWFLRFFILINLSRAYPVFSAEGDTAIYLGDPLFASKDKVVLKIVVVVGTAVMYFAHEGIMLVERQGGFVGEAMRIKDLIKNGFSHFPFVAPQQKDFNRTCYYVCLFWNFSCPLIILYVTILYNYELVINLYNHFSFKTLFFEVAWTLTLTPLVALLAAQLVCLGAVSCLYTTVHHYHMGSLKNATSLLLKSNDKPYNSDIRFITRHATVLFNEMDLNFRKIRFLIFYFYTGVALQSLWFIQFAIIIGNHSVVMDTLIAGLGIIIITHTLIISLVCARLTNKVRRLYPMWHQVYLKSKATIIMKLKMIEILNRTTLPTTGFQIGDFGAITTDFVLIFLLEFASMMMMLSCNFGSFF